MMFGNTIKLLSRTFVRNIHAQYKLAPIIDVHPEVQKAVLRNQPVVALESTIITHGMPHPQNYDTAREVEELVRLNGAVPATIAILNGRIKVGLSETDMLQLSSKRQDEVIKCSRRDLPFVVAQRQSGGTTVAATMLIAHQSGIKIFATGGVGGVHREGHVTMDISADLVELGRTPMAVICSGVKSILDIPRTLEYLETQGVCVATLGSENGNFPDFYTRDSGYKVPYNLAGPAEAAELIRTLYDLQLKSGILIGVPIPKEFAADKQLINEAIKQAYQQANVQNISGKHVTPFLLAAIADITKGNSLNANMALIKNNASVAAQIANELCVDKCYSLKSRKRGSPLIIGASILDLSLTMLDDMPSELNGATYQTHAKQSAGGVGRNIAEGIFKLHGKADFISVVGNDQLGKSLLKLIPEPLQEGIIIDDSAATSLCSVIFDKMGDCKLILGSMDIHKNITPECVLREEHLVRDAPLIIIDSNLSLPTMECILNSALQHRRPVFFEPTDMRIAGKPFALPRFLTQQIRMISPNVQELRTIVECMTETTVDWTPDVGQDTAVVLGKTKEMLLKIQTSFDCILVTLGHHGVLLSMPRGMFEAPLYDKQTGKYCYPLEAGRSDYVTRFYAAPKVEKVANVSGAGDSFSSGFITGLLRCYDIEHCVAFGFAAAQRALISEAAVPGRYFADEHEEAKALRNVLEQLRKFDI